MAPEPIPLRTLTTLLNYERTTSDPRFLHTSLHSTSIADSSKISSLTGLGRQIVNARPKSVQRINVHTFASDPNIDPNISSPNIPATCTLHPYSELPESRLTPAQKDVIYYESHGHDGCYKALALYQEFFSLCPRDQKLSIQITNESPVLVPVFPRNILEFRMKGPKLLSITSVHSSHGGSFITGADNESLHSVVAFPHPNPEHDGYFVVDMTRMQWGEEGKGQFGEPYFMGTVQVFEQLMGNVCDGMEELGIGAGWINPSEHTELMRECAERAMSRWKNRENEHWCEYCGIGGRSLKACGGCKEKKIWYCGTDHQKAGWKLHKFTCEKKKAAT